MIWSTLWAKEGTRDNMEALVLQNRTYLQIALASDPRDKISYWSSRLARPFCYQASSESASSSAAWLRTAGSACLSAGRKPGWRHWFLYPPAQMASGPKHFQTCIKRMWFKSGGERGYRRPADPRQPAHGDRRRTCLQRVSSLCLFLFFTSILVREGLKSKSSKSAQSSEPFVDLEIRPHLLRLFGLISPFFCSRPARIFCVYKQRRRKRKSNINRV